MQSLHFMQTAACLLAMAAAGGLTMAAIRWWGNPRPPSWLAMGHGLLAGAALTLLAYACFTVGLPSRGQLALALLATAAAGGAAINLLFHSRMHPLPKSWIVGHALLAVAGFATLLSAIFS